MKDAFEQCRSILSSAVAEREGIVLHRRRTRLWALCPLHGDQTPSLMFDEAGRWYCFGCQKGGDAVAFYAALHNLSPRESAKRLYEMFRLPVTGARYVPAPPRPGRILRDAIEAWLSKQWDDACRQKFSARSLLQELETLVKEFDFDFEFCYRSPDYCKTLREYIDAEIRLDVLQSASKLDLMAMMLEERDEAGRV